MPQMAPLWWELMFFMFTISFIIMNMIIFYNKHNNQKMKMPYMKETMQFKWKW
nr:ATP synthase subunit 8 [Laminiceps obscurior]